MNEYLISVDNYKKPKVVEGNKGNYYIILRLLLMEPGTNPLFPLMGCGIKSRGMFILEEEIQDLKLMVQKQVDTYLPDFGLTSIEMELDNNNSLKITISSESEEYTFDSNSFNLDLNSVIEEYSDN